MIVADALQQAIYNKLNVGTITAQLSDDYDVTAIFTDVPQSDDAELPAFFPYIVIGGDTISPFDDKDSTGGDAIVQVDVYSRAPSMGAVKAIADDCYSALHRQPLTITGVGWIDTQLQGVDFTRDPDGLTKRAIMQFRVTYME